MSVTLTPPVAVDEQVEESVRPRRWTRKEFHRMAALGLIRPEEHPTAADVRLLVEVSDTTLRFDRGKKLKAYARFGIPDYWILNLRERRLEVYRDPAGPEYRSVALYIEEQVVSPREAPNASIQVADLLPPIRQRKRT
jgi:Uma2 family endonuclease